MRREKERGMWCKENGKGGGGEGRGGRTESFVHPRSRGTSVNKRRNIFLTRRLPPFLGIAANEVFKYLNTKIYVEGTCMNYA